MIVKTGDGREQSIVPTVVTGKDSPPPMTGIRRTGGETDRPDRSEYKVLSDIVYDGERHIAGEGGFRVPLMSATRGATVLLTDKDARALLARGAVQKIG